MLSQFLTVTDYNHALAKQHQDSSKILYANAREAFNDAEFNEAIYWQQLAEAASHAARTYLGIKGNHYDSC